MTHERGVAALVRMINRGDLKIDELKKLVADIEALSSPSPESLQTAAEIKDALAKVAAAHSN